MSVRYGVYFSLLALLSLQASVEGEFIGDFKQPSKEWQEEVAEIEDPLGGEQEDLSIDRKAAAAIDSPTAWAHGYYPPTYSSSVCQTLESISDMGDSFVLRDGSVWLVHDRRDRSLVLWWLATDPLLITQNTSWFSNAHYRVLNERTDEAVSVDLSQGPYVDGMYTRYVQAIDPFSERMVLSDGSQWELCSWDRSVYRAWQVGDVIILGVNSGWRSDYENLLINVTTDDCSRGVRQ
jgi:hypothetical protein